MKSRNGYCMLKYCSHGQITVLPPMITVPCVWIFLQDDEVWLLLTFGCYFSREWFLRSIFTVSNQNQRRWALQSVFGRGASQRSADGKQGLKVAPTKRCSVGCSRRETSTVGRPGMIRWKAWLVRLGGIKLVPRSGLTKGIRSWTVGLEHAASINVWSILSSADSEALSLAQTAHQQ